MGTTDRDYADKPSDAVEFLNTCALIFGIVGAAAILGFIGYAFTLVMFSL